MKHERASKKCGECSRPGTLVRSRWVALLALMASVYGRAADTVQLVAKVTHLTGEARCMIANSWQPLRKEWSVPIGSVVQTASASELDVKLAVADVAGQATIHLGPDTTIKLERLDSSSAGSLRLRDVEIEVRMGALRAAVSGDAEWRLAVNAPYGNYRVRRRGGAHSQNADFTLSASEVAVHRGELNVSSWGGPERILSAGDRWMPAAKKQGSEGGGQLRGR